MMNYIWAFIIIISIVISVIFGNVSSLSDIFLTAGNEAIELSMTLLGGMCFWSGIMQIADKAKITDRISSVISPLLRLAMPDLKKSKAAEKAVTMNVAANLLGLGNAATPLGLQAMQELDRVNPHPKCASNSMITFVVLNTASIQLIPSTVALLRTQYGSSNALDILPCVWMTSVCALTVGMTVNIILRQGKELNHDKCKRLHYPDIHRIRHRGRINQKNTCI